MPCDAALRWRADAEFKAARLADGLKDNGNDVEGWQRLLRAYLVLGEKEKAISAADAAKRALANDADKLRRIEDTIKNLELEG